MWACPKWSPNPCPKWSPKSRVWKNFFSWKKKNFFIFFFYCYMHDYGYLSWFTRVVLCITLFSMWCWSWISNKKQVYIWNISHFWFSGIASLSVKNSTPYSGPIKKKKICTRAGIPIKNFFLKKKIFVVGIFFFWHPRFRGPYGPQTAFWGPYGPLARRAIKSHIGDLGYEGIGDLSKIQKSILPKSYIPNDPQNIFKSQNENFFFF